jgi:hypothetical protein
LGKGAPSSFVIESPLQGDSVLATNYQLLHGLPALAGLKAVQPEGVALGGE